MSLWNFALEYSQNQTNVVPYHADLEDALSATDFPSAADGVTAPIIMALFSSQELLADNFAQRSRAETFGGHFISQVVPLCEDEELQKDLTEHSNDEYRHGRMFDALVWRVTHGTEPPPPSQETTKLREAEIEAFSGDPKAFVVSTHVAELKSLYELGEYSKCANGLPYELRKKVVSVLSNILSDEVRHASYSGNWVLRFLHDESVSDDYLVDCFRSYEVDAWKQAASNCGRLARYFEQLFLRGSDKSEQLVEHSGKNSPCYSHNSSLSEEVKSYLTGEFPSYPEAYFRYLDSIERSIPPYLEEALSNVFNCACRSNFALKRTVDYFTKLENDSAQKDDSGPSGLKAVTKAHTRDLRRFLVGSRLGTAMSTLPKPSGDLIKSVREMRNRSEKKLARSAGFLSGHMSVENDECIDPVVSAHRIAAYLWKDIESTARTISRSF